MIFFYYSKNPPTRFDFYYTKNHHIRPNKEAKISNSYYDVEKVFFVGKPALLKCTPFHCPYNEGKNGLYLPKEEFRLIILYFYTNFKKSLIL